jgi:hypothetical protein
VRWDEDDVLSTSARFLLTWTFDKHIFPMYKTLILLDWHLTGITPDTNIRAARYTR